MYLQSYEALCRSFFVVVELKGALNVVFSEGRLYASGTCMGTTAAVHLRNLRNPRHSISMRITFSGHVLVGGLPHISSRLRTYSTKSGRGGINCIAEASVESHLREITSFDSSYN
jgi:hypothetical protein